MMKLKKKRNKQVEKVVIKAKMKKEVEKKMRIVHFFRNKSTKLLDNTRNIIPLMGCAKHLIYEYQELNRFWQ